MCLVLAKAAKMLVDEDDIAATELYKDALDIYETEEMDLQGGDTYKAAVSFLVRKRHLQDAIEIMERQNKALEKNVESLSGTLFRNYLSIVVCFRCNAGK